MAFVKPVRTVSPRGPVAHPLVGFAPVNEPSIPSAGKALRRRSGHAGLGVRGWWSWMPLLLASLVLTACGGGGSSSNSDTTPPNQPPGAPANLWRAPDKALPASANYVYLLDKSVVGREREFVYTAVSSVLEVSSASTRLTVTVRGDESWFGEMQSPAGASELAPSYHEGLQRFPVHDAASGGLQWWGLTASCDGLVGWFAVDAAAYEQGRLVAIEARFEQRCPSGESLLGQIRWRADDTTRPPEPLPVPAGLWAPPAAQIPARGNVVYIESEDGDPTGNGITAVYTPLDAVLWTESIGGYFSIHVRGERYWDGQFQAMSHLSALRAGYYTGLRRYPFHNPAKGGLIWSDPQRICNLESGWIAVDAIHEDERGFVDSIELRFEQRCEGASAALRGFVRWSSDDITQAAGPVATPETLWRPSPDPVPTASSFWRLESGAGDPIGNGQTVLLEPPASSITIDAAGGRLRWQSTGPASSFASGEFLAMDSLARIEVGWYDGLRRPGAHNPTRGGLLVQVDGRVCLDVDGWVAVDRVVYDGNQLREIDLRFAQACAGAAAPLYGQLKWVAVAAGD
jgi:hypothetical protein